MKICSSCKQELSLESFNKNKKSLDGHRGACRNCQLDYNRKRLNQTPRRIVKDGFKYCPECKQELSLNMFGLNVSNYDFVHGYCKECMKQRYIKNKDIHRAYAIQQNFNLSWEQYTNLFNEQDGKCAICNKDIYLAATDKNKTAHVDHCHKTGKIRGLLCARCNHGLGVFEDDIEVLQGTINYLQESKSNE